MATLYWGPKAGSSTGIWDNSTITNWFTDVGRTVPALSAPTSADDVVFDSASDAGASFMININAGAACRDWTVTTTDFPITFSHTSPITVSGSLSFPTTNIVRSGQFNITFNATSAQTVNFNGYNLDNSITFNGVGGTWQLLSDLGTTSTASASLVVTLTNGTINLNNFTLNAARFISSTLNTRAIQFGSGKLALFSAAGTTFDMAIANNFTYTGTPRIEGTFSGSGAAARIFRFGSSSGGTASNTPNIHIVSGTDMLAIQGAVNTVDLTGFSGTYGNYGTYIYGNFIASSGCTFSAGTNALEFIGVAQSITTMGKSLDFPMVFANSAGVFTFQDAITQVPVKTFTFTFGTIKLKAGTVNVVGSFVATNNGVAKTLSSTTPGTQATISQASGAVVTSNMTIIDSNATGGALWNAPTAQSNVNGGNNTGWNFGVPILSSMKYRYTRRKNKVILQS
ncbi:hypothetical protein UFOVP581_31 [uncultured Caudovirales phage]|uniref:Uncharacterized protein n=1 Tax=uncultured Caudovirales phage TaxID=2100421 RepID=A0A6J5PIK8_9CAUD|nr:hypothetical protein UFOVP581_31 [uncultured Caudovirales phage]